MPIARRVIIHNPENGVVVSSSVMKRRVAFRAGFTLIELMIAIAIVGVLAAIAFVLYDRSTEKARSVEADVALAEVARLERLQYTSKGKYSDDLAAIGFAPAPALKYYEVGVTISEDGLSYHAWALPRFDSASAKALFQSGFPDGQTTTAKTDPQIVLAQRGVFPRGAGDPATAAAGGGGTGAAAGGSSAGTQVRSECQAATLAEDGRLDMNFCFKSINEGKPLSVR